MNILRSNILPEQYSYTIPYPSWYWNSIPFTYNVLHNYYNYLKLEYRIFITVIN